ncbi:hypothetical protein BC829DRAFT_448385 [Chytridium lagenaria]|nr:hypothetical protein BC829DRAFT_448385 [Chytridium lagenaria]
MTSRTIRSSSSARSSKEPSKKAEDAIPDNAAPSPSTQAVPTASSKEPEKPLLDTSITSPNSTTGAVDTDGSKREAPGEGKVPREDAVRTAMKNAQAAAGFMNNMIVSSESAEKSATKKPKKSQSEAKVEEKTGSSRWQTTVKRGVPSFADYISLKELVDARNPILGNLNQRLSPVEASVVPLHDPSFPYPYHPATADSLRSTLTALINIDLLPYMSRIPMTSSGLIMLASPFEGSEIYLRKMVESVIAELSRNQSSSPSRASGILFASVSNHDLFPRLSGYDMVSAPPLKPGSIDPAEGTFFSGRSGGNGRRTAKSGSPIGAFGLVVEVQRPSGTKAEDEPTAEDIPQIPYPWGMNYLSPSGHLMSLMSNRIQPDNTANSPKPKNSKSPIVIVAPSTPTFKYPIPKGGQPVTGIAALLQQFSGEADFGNAGEADELATIPVYPPVQDGAATVKKFRQLLRRDRKVIYRKANLREIEVVWKSLATASNSSIPSTSAPIVSTALGANLGPSNVIFPSFHDAGVIKALEEASGENAGIAGVRGGGLLPSVLDHRLLSPMEVERLVTYIIGVSGKRSAAKVGGDSVAALAPSILPEDVASGMRIFTSGLAAANAVQAGLEFAGIFANPRDQLNLTKHEQRLLDQCLVKPEKMSTKFGNIGGLAKTKDVINELIRLPLLKPELFSFGAPLESFFFGPPGTGKTMLARAVAAESGANFLNVQMSSVQSMWVGENEKNVKALFSLARKLRPCVIFVDEIDALLKVRQRSNPSWVTNTINEWMLEWDGIQSENGKGVIVVGATNRPFDLDEAVLRRLPRRILVDLPGTEERKDILGILLREENVVYTATDGSHSASSREKTLIELAEATKGYSGSDLKNLCIAAALRAVRSQYGSMFSTTPAATPSTAPQSRVILKDDFFAAIETGEVVPSLNEKNELMKQLVEWDKMYGTASGGYNKGTDGWGFAL